VEHRAPPRAERPGPPFEAINVAAAAGTSIPAALEAQLADGGRLVVPVENNDQRLYVVHKTASGFERRGLERVRFVPLIAQVPGAGSA
jgi:protein-L-isoaspartate(D-aspartate) O-methyltransferase